MTTTSVARLSGLLLLAAALVAAPACAPSAADVAEEAIVGGTRETGYLPVYFMYRIDGAACTATLISPRVVLTARHCVALDRGGAAPASYFRLYPGTDQRSFTAEYRVSRVEIIPGSSGDIRDGRAQDVALLVLTAPASETPIDIAREASPGSLVGTNGTAVGFGQTPSGGSGTKYRAAAHITEAYAGLIFVDPVVCPGDSGGPLIGADGLIYGVASFITSADGISDPVCGTAPGAYNEIYRHIEWINGVIQSVGDACFPQPEVCDGLDNDCNDAVDEPCLALGSPCTEGAECVGGICAATVTGAVCSQPCDPMRPALGCPPTFYCASSPGSCDGFCVPGVPGTAPLETPCTSDTECESGVCRDPGDGRSRCLDPCRGDRGDCLDGEVCVASDGACSVCIPAISFGSPHGLGEVCAEDSECRSNQCEIRAGIGECVEACAAGSRCDAGFICTGDVCVLDRSQPVGGPCLSSADCARGAVCAAQGERRWCTASCSAAAPCPSGFDCLDAGGSLICVPMGGLVGDRCTTDLECSTGLCRDGGDGLQCTVPCSAEDRCGPGFLCQPLEDGTRGCFPPPAPPTSGGGCAATGRTTSGNGGLLAMVLLGLAALARRRARA